MLLLASLAASAVAQTTNVKCVTTAGSFTAVVERSNSPQGVDRFLELVSSAAWSKCPPWQGSSISSGRA